MAAEKLREVHQITLGRETLRLWMIEDGLWLDRRQRRKQVHQPRRRRECVGELVQIDGCERGTALRIARSSSTRWLTISTPSRPKWPRSMARQGRASSIESGLIG